MTTREFLDRYIMKVQKPARYVGGEYGSVVKKKEDVDISFAFCFPDMYDVGMSHLGIKILYHMFNDRKDVRCERAFAPNTDMEQLMREKGVLLYGLESGDPIKEFDFIGFTLQYELTYTNILNMLDLAGLEPHADKRSDSDPIVICGGPCACNPAPLEEFADIFFIGEGEEKYDDLFDAYKKHKGDKQAFLRAASEIDCMYVPKYHKKGDKVKRAIVRDLDNMYYPKTFVVPSSEAVHDRAMIEIMRGCIRGCRFCQAGTIYRPFRQKSPEVLFKQAKELLENTGYDELSLISLSTSDYCKINELADSLLEYCNPKKINLAVPSLRVDNFTKELYEKTQSVRKSGLTFAPEAGTQRLRDVINKNVTEEEIMNTARIAFEGGATAVKLYFMIGLPTETDEDIKGIADTAQRIIDLFYSMNMKRNKGVTVTISLATFVPKAFTPFQWEPQIPMEEIRRRQQYLVSLVGSNRRIRLNYHDSYTSVLEAVFARGDRKLGQVIYKAWKKGCRFDAWDEYFRYDLWTEAFDECGLSIEAYANRRLDEADELPWEDIDMGIAKKWLWAERNAAYSEKTTLNCKEKCSGCGITKICKGDVCK
ncbi:MAG: TIGR03960 family B12-binding radical SAM protein [Ruminococcaceae bacterium]|nr:TIGR03960 family B12-binding radical SAM protein [Oscillospiraceae bacterium]